MFSKKSNNISTLILGTIMIVTIIILYTKEEREHKTKDNIYFNNFNYYVKGEITEIKYENLKKNKIIALKIDSSNINLIDPRDSLSLYILLLKDNYAVLYDSGDLYYLKEYEIGDIVIIDGKKISCYNNEMKLKFDKTEIDLRKRRWFPKQRVDSLFDAPRKKTLRNRTL